jgi:multidrug efflux system membrane fusion protein
MPLAPARATARLGCLFGLGLSAAASASAISPAMAQSPAAPQRPPVSISVQPATRGDLPLRIEQVCSVQPLASIGLRSRVDAQIEQIMVPDGARVQQGDALVRLDSRQIESQIRQAEATLEKDKATLAQNNRDIARYSQLVKQQATTQLNLDNAHTAAAVTTAQIAADTAALETLKVQLSYYTLRAPVSGQLGVFTYKAGAMVRAIDTTPMATLNQTAPIYVVFSTPQRYLSDLRAAMAANGAAVSVRPQGATQWIDGGSVTVLDNMIDSATGSLVVRGSFANADATLWPGQLCDARVTLRTEPNVVSAPREAVQIGQRGNFVFVVDNGVARLRPVKAGRDQDGRVVILEGLNGVETLVVDGANLLTDGAKVEVRGEPKKDAS